MMLFGKKNDINAGVQECRETAGAVLLDVRETDEFSGGHISGAENVPLSGIAEAELPEDKSTPIFVYCRSGARSAKAAGFLRKKGYSVVKDIGGIMAWSGKVER